MTDSLTNYVTKQNNIYINSYPIDHVCIRNFFAVSTCPYNINKMAERAIL